MSSFREYWKFENWFRCFTRDELEACFVKSKDECIVCMNTSRQGMETCFVQTRDGVVLCANATGEKLTPCMASTRYAMSNCCDKTREVAGPVLESSRDHVVAGATVAREHAHPYCVTVCDKMVDCMCITSHAVLGCLGRAGDELGNCILSTPGCLNHAYNDAPGCLNETYAKTAACFSVTGAHLAACWSRHMPSFGSKVCLAQRTPLCLIFGVTTCYKTLDRDSMTTLPVPLMGLFRLLTTQYDDYISADVFYEFVQRIIIVVLPDLPASIRAQMAFNEYLQATGRTVENSGPYLDFEMFANAMRKILFKLVEPGVPAKMEKDSVLVLRELFRRCFQRKVTTQEGEVTRTRFDMKLVFDKDNTGPDKINGASSFNQVFRLEEVSGKIQPTYMLDDSTQKKVAFDDSGHIVALTEVCESIPEQVGERDAIDYEMIEINDIVPVGAGIASVWNTLKHKQEPFTSKFMSHSTLEQLRTGIKNTIRIDAISLKVTASDHSASWADVSPHFFSSDMDSNFFQIGVANNTLLYASDKLRAYMRINSYIQECQMSSSHLKAAHDNTPVYLKKHGTRRKEVKLVMSEDGNCFVDDEVNEGRVYEKVRDLLSLSLSDVL